MTPFETKDSGSRRRFDTGSQRDMGKGKGRYDLISPLALRRIAELLERGANKYEARNWEKGQPQSVFMDAALRHLFKYLEGMRDEDHLAAAAWNVMAMIHQEVRDGRGGLAKGLLDLPNYTAPSKFRGLSDKVLAPKYCRRSGTEEAPVDTRDATVSGVPDPAVCPDQYPPEAPGPDAGHTPSPVPGPDSSDPPV